MARENKKSPGVLISLRLALLLLAGVLTVSMVLCLLVWQVDIRDKQDRLADLNDQIAVQEMRNKEARDAVDALGTEEGMNGYAEQRARDDLDYAKPGERIIVDVGGGG